MSPDYEKIAASVEVPGEVEIDPADQAEAARTFYPVDHPKYQGIAEAKGYDQSYARLQRTHYSHEAMIDVIISNPNIKQNELAKQFDKSVPWVSRIIGSDAFQAALAKRREEITDPFLIATVEERMRGLAMQSLDVLAEKLQTTQSAELALKSLDITAKSLGFGARDRGGATQNNQFIIQLPPKSVNSTDWVQDHGMKRVENG